VFSNLNNLYYYSVNLRSSLTIDADGTIYVPGNDYMFALTNFGSVKWQQTVSSVQTSPTIAYDGTIYISANNNNLYALYHTGSIKWSFATLSTIYSCVAIDTKGLIYFGSTDSNFYSLHPTGSIVWSFYMYSPIKSSPAIGLDGTIYVGTTGGIMYAMNPDGKPDWFYETVSGSFDVSSPAVGSDGSIYIGSISSDHNLYAFSNLGTLNWYYTTDGTIYASPAIGPDGSIVVNSGSTPYVYNISYYGTLNWRISLNTYSQYTSPVIGADGTIYISADHLYAFYPSGSLLWITLIDVYPATPVIADNGLIYTGSGSTVYSVGTVVSSQSPLVSLYEGLQVGAAAPKNRLNSLNTVSSFDF
jgi:hypothetical protein